MGIAQTASAVMIFLTGLLPAGCHKTAPAPTPTNDAPATNSATQTDPKIRNLGVITLTNRAETGLHLTNGEDCLFETKMIDGQNMQISLAIESRNDFGETRNFAATQFTTQPGKHIQVAVGDLKVNFTPLLSTNE